MTANGTRRALVATIEFTCENEPTPLGSGIDPAKRHRMKRPAFARELALEIGADDFVGSCRFGNAERTTFEEMFVSRSMVLVPVPQVIVVGDDAKLPTGTQESMELDE